MSGISFLTEGTERPTPIDSEDWVDVPTRFLVGLHKNSRSLDGRAKSVTISKTTIKIALVASGVITGAFVVSIIALLNAGLIAIAGIALLLLGMNHMSFMKLGMSL